MQVGIRIRLYPTIEQAEYLNKACGVARFTYNWALAEYKVQLEKYKQTQLKEDKPSIYELKKKFNQVKREEFSFVTEVTKCASEQPFFNLGRAFTNFFKGFKFPKFHRKGLHDSFYLSNDKIKVEGLWVTIPKLGKVKLAEKLKYSDKIINAVVSRKANQYYISIIQDLSPESFDDFKSNHTRISKVHEDLDITNFSTNKSDRVGIDLGLKTSIVTSDGEYIQSPKPLKNKLKKLKKLSRNLAKKQKKSCNRYKAQMKVAKLHLQIANIRKDWIHKVSKYLCQNYKLIAMENLQVANMLKNHYLAKAISDLGIGLFTTILKYKAPLFNIEIVQVDKFYPSSKTCSGCGSIKKDLTLKDRLYQCNDCGLSIDRDYNASLNILNYCTHG